MNNLLRSLVVFVLTGCTIAVCIVSPSAKLDDSAGILMSGEEIRQLPLFLGDYVGHPMEPGNRELELLPDDTEYEKMVYVTDDNSKLISCQIVLAGADSRSIHRPEICLPSQGWTIEERFVEKIDIASRTLEVTILVVSREEQDQSGSMRKILAYNAYWFVGRDKTTPSHKERMILTAIDNVFRNINHRWAYVTVNTRIPFPHGLRERETSMRDLKAFIGQAVPHIHREW